MLLTSKRRTVTGQGSGYWSAPYPKEALIDYKLPAHRLYGALKPDQPSSVSLLPSAVVAKFCHLMCVARLQKWHQPPHPPPGANDVIIFYATLIRPPLAGTFFLFWWRKNMGAGSRGLLIRGDNSIQRLVETIPPETIFCLKWPSFVGRRSGLSSFCADFIEDFLN